MATTPHTKNKLGTRQRAVLDALVSHRYWHSGCGWTWGTDKTIRVVLDSLVDRGAARIDDSLTVYNKRVYLPAAVTIPPRLPLADNVTGSATAADFAALEMLRRTASNDFAITLDREQVRAVLRLAECGFAALEGMKP